ncbi:hypothetical protein ASZ90_015158 [hydrocarbon metagenome]|uniref:Uncharacterized protein n=1 Tax=hydrocarbon metagenome TaxID=938273 RepID=A0A0W8F2S1_9ZZZZ
MNPRASFSQVCCHHTPPTCENPPPHLKQAQAAIPDQIR